MKKQKLKVLMTAAEVSPFAKVGGLADVTGSLPAGLKNYNCDARLIMPLYGSINKKRFRLKKIASNIKIASGERKEKINIWKSKLPSGNIIYFIDHKDYFGAKKIYYGNSAQRFAFFSLAVLHVLPIIRFKPNVLHCHDFHTALTIDILKVSQKYSAYIKDIRTLYTIHNLNYQGKSEIELLSTGNLSKDSLKSLSKDAQDGDVNFMAQGIINADWVNTVSPTYAKEIATSVYGAGLERIIRANQKKISGIINGIDVDFFNPAKDEFIKHKYSFKDLSGKEKNKLYLQKSLKLPQDAGKPLLGFVSRLAWQKGLELFTEKLIKSSDCQFVFLGTGAKEYENALKKLAKKFPAKVSANIMFDVKLANQIYAASDIFAVPSRFEPCGLTQMVAMRYGAVPVVRATGGLKDTVDKKVGFTFDKFNSREFAKALARALKTYYDEPRKWKKIQKNGMSRDFSWKKSGKEYLKIYKKIIKK